MSENKDDETNKFKNNKSKQNEKNILFSDFFLKNNELKQKGRKIKFLCKKSSTSLFKVKKYQNIIPKRGRWSEEEHDKFLEGLVLYGIKWKNFKQLIKSRSLNQIRSHAQKFYLKMKLCKDVNLNIDFTLNSICNIKDMINHIKSKDANYNIVNVFKYLNYEYDNLDKSIKKAINNNNKIIIEIKNDEKNSLEKNNFIDNNLLINQNNKINIQKEKSKYAPMVDLNQNLQLNDNILSCNNNTINYNIYNINKNSINNINILNNLLINDFLNLNNNNNSLINYSLRDNINMPINNRIPKLNPLLPSYFETKNNLYNFNNNANITNNLNNNIISNNLPYINNNYNVYNEYYKYNIGENLNIRNILFPHIQYNNENNIFYNNINFK